MPAEVPGFRIRRATVLEAPIVARHRVAMFTDMGRMTPEAVAPLTGETVTYLHEAMPRDEYVGWLASPEGDPWHVVSGAGLMVRRVPPFPYPGSGGVAVAWGRQGVVLNVYTDPAFRRLGLARRLLTEVLDWARTAKLESLVLHATPDGRGLYESLGFAASNEMRFMGSLE